MIFETHAHYDDDQFDEDREELLSSLSKNDVGYVVNVGASIETSKNTLELVDKYDFMYGAVGVHPNETGELDDEKFEWLRKAAKHPKIVAIGEIGLDYYWDEPEVDIQEEWFDKQMDLARECSLPMIIHSRDASKHTLEMIKAKRGHEIGGIIHCYSYSLDTAKKYLDMGFYIGIGGVVTFSNAKKLKEVVAYTPLEQIVLETDCPYLAPVPNRGKRNSSLNLTYIANEIATIKNISYDEVVKVTEENAKRVYRIGDIK